MPRWSRLLVLLALLDAPGLARAQQPPAGGTSAAASLGAERQRVRSDLDRVNAEIDALKRDKRSWREDRELRSRMADADVLARRLTDLDLRIERLNPGAGRRNETPPPVPPPEARPSDDRAALEAKADILTDQARHLQSQADVLAGRVADLKGRQELRRRAGQLERDPFSPLEQSKRRIATGTPTSSLGGKDLNTGVTGGGGPSRGASEGATTPPPGGVTTSGTPGATAPGASPGSTGLTGDSSKGATTTGAVAPLAVPLGTTGGADAPGSVAGQFRGILDAATLAEIRRLESGGSARSNVQAMERALAALRARAAQLNASATDLRMRAKSTP